jgi:beta-mannanase
VAPVPQPQPQPQPVTGAGAAAPAGAAASWLESATGELALGLYRPDFPDDLGAMADVLRAGEADAPRPRPPAIVSWYATWGGWKREFAVADLERVAATGAVPLITWEPWAGAPHDTAWSLRQAVLSGVHDAYIRGWAAGLAAFGGPVLLRFAHEMNHHGWYPWAVGRNGNTVADALAAWRHVRAIFRAAGAGNVQWVWNPNTLGDAPAERHEAVYRELYPGDAEVDWVGVDVFNTGPALDWGAPYWRSFRDTLAAPYAALARISGRPLLLPEVGCTEAGGSKAAWIAEALDPATAAHFPRVRALVWFDTPKEQPWHLDSSPGARAAWAAGVRAGRGGSAS